MVVCDPSGLLPTVDCPGTVSEVFLAGNEPTGADTLYRTFQVNRETGYLATIFTPLDLVDTRTYLVVPSNARPWAAAAGLPLPPTQYDLIKPPFPLPEANLTAPALFASVRGTAQILGTAAAPSQAAPGSAEFSSYQIQVGAGLNPTGWLQLGDESTSPVRAGLLATWDTTQFEDGLYALRLVVRYADQQVKIALTQVTVDNTPPQVSLDFPKDGQVMEAKPSLLLTFKATAFDATGLERVEWWFDSQLLAVQAQEPFLQP